MRTTRRTAPTAWPAKETLYAGLEPHGRAQRMVAAMAGSSAAWSPRDLRHATGSFEGKPLIAPKKNAQTPRTSHRAIDSRIREHHDPFGAQ